MSDNLPNTHRAPADELYLSALRARVELKRAGLFDRDSVYEGAIGDAVMELLRVFARQGHSGASAYLTADLFVRLVRGEVLTPLTSDPAEWREVADGVWQNTRDSRAFSNNGGATWNTIGGTRLQSPDR